MPTSDPRQHSPSAERNRQPILDVLQRVLPARGVALEIASGSGEHAVHFAAGLPGWTWQPSDAEPSVLPSIAAWIAGSGLSNVRAPLLLDVTASSWPGVPTVDAIFCANMLHIAPWAACQGLMRGAARHLARDGRLVTYGPYFIDDVATAPSNLAFDADLRARNPAWGVRNLRDVEAEASKSGLQLVGRFAMPANNFTLVFRFGRAALK